MSDSVVTVELRGLGVTYRKRGLWSRTAVTAVRGVDLDIAAGETVGLVGESGSGKTTLGRVALGLVAPTHGSFHFEGRPFDARVRREGALAVVFQHPEWALNPRLRSGASIAEPLVIQGLGERTERERRVAEMLSEVGLDAAFAGRYPGELSGGQRQRMAIARALITRPRFVVFDEAVSALDVSVQSQVLNLLRRLQRERGLSFLFITHNLAVVEYMADEVCVMSRGKIVERGTVDKIFDSPEQEYTKKLLASIPSTDPDARRLTSAG